MRAPVAYVITGPPRTKKNGARIVKGARGQKARLIQSAAAMEWANSAVLQLRSQCRGSIPWQEPTNLRAHIYRDRRVGDLGNYLAAICDALQKAGVVTNDKWILGFDGSRLHTDPKNPRVMLVLEDLP